ncbi:MAG: hypothetical protein ACT4NU_05790 [Chromatiales bacterium]
MKALSCTLALVTLAGLNCGLVPAGAETIVTDEIPSDTVSVLSVTENNGVVEGMIVNESPHPVKDVELLITYEWLWNEEFSPGDDNPGRAVFQTVPEEIPAGASVPFSYQPPSPLPVRSDGRFLISAEVVGYRYK